MRMTPEEKALRAAQRSFDSCERKPRALVIHEYEQRWALKIGLAVCAGTLFGIVMTIAAVMLSGR